MALENPDLSQFDVLKDLPWLSREYLGNSIYSYLLTLTTFIALWAALHMLRRFVMAKLAAKSEDAATHVQTQTWASLSVLLMQISPGIFPLIALFIATKRLTLPETAERGIKILAMIAVTFQVARLLGLLAAFFISRARLAKGSADDAAIRNTNQNLTILAKVGIWVALLLFLLDNLGFNVSTFIAGLGVGGVAIALASQAILGDTFSSFAIALDKPFEVGDFIVVDDLMGNVEHIGLKTTRIRSLAGELLIFANSDLTKSRIKNFKKMYRRRAVFKIGVTYETPLEALPRVVEILKSAVTSQADVELDRAHFATFGDSALVYEVVYFVLKPEYNLAMDIQQAINLRILTDFAAEGIEMAYPTQTIHVASTDERHLVRSSK